MIISIYSSGMEVDNTVTMSKASDLQFYCNNDDNLYAENRHLQLY